MYHTEGFVNKYTIDIKRHIIMLTLEQHSRPWYVWCVMRKAIAETELLQQELSFWLQQTLLINGICNIRYAQRELNRLGGYLQNRDSLKVKRKDIHLFMYYQGGFYSWDSDSVLRQNGKSNRKLYREISQGVYGYVSEEALWEHYDKHCGEDSFRVEELANEWEMSLIEACGNGELEDAFFLIWEDTVDFSKR